MFIRNPDKTETNYIYLFVIDVVVVDVQFLFHLLWIFFTLASAGGLSFGVLSDSKSPQVFQDSSHYSIWS